MKIAIASGKGGTGKTMVTAALAASWKSPVAAVDLDVEEPNLHLFLQPEITGTRNAVMEVPLVDEKKCTYCRKCADLCQYKAISVFNKVILTFPEMCHGCGGCMAICPEQAICADQRILGEVIWGAAGAIGFAMGRLRVGEAMSPPLIRQVIEHATRTSQGDAAVDLLFDAPPGASCPAVSSVIESDFILLVTEPTPFGAFDLRLAHQAFTPLAKPMAVVINRAGVGNDEVYDYCRKSGLPILAEIPYDRAIAEAYAQGRIIARSSEPMAALFANLARDVKSYDSGHREVRHA
jgi:MinD superfamily P-loop ATPase